MNISSEDNNLPLFKYNPEISSQFLIQTNETQEFVQIPNICDDFLLTGLEEGTVTWTLEGLPVLLNGQNDSQPLLINQLSSGESLEDLQPQQEILSDILQQNNIELNNEVNDNTLGISDKNFLIENGLFISNDVIDEPVNNVTTNYSLANNDNTFQLEDGQQEILKTSEEIQSADISSQETFIDINGTLIPQQSILNINNQDLFLNVEGNSNIFKSKPKKRKQKSISLLKKPTKNDALANLVRNYNIEEETSDLLVENNSETNTVLSNDETVNNLIKILNLNGTATVLNVDGSFLNNKSELKENNCITNEIRTKLTVKEEPDSTVVIDADDTFNINDLATIITAYSCKKCDFACNDRDEFLIHFKNKHLKLGPVSQQISNLQSSFLFALPDSEQGLLLQNKKRKLKKRLKLPKEQNVHTINIICENGAVTSVIPIQNHAISVKEESNSEKIPSSLSETDILLSDSLNMQVQLIKENSPEVEKEISETVPLDENFQFYFEDNESTRIAVIPEELEKKIMRIKSRKKKVQESLIRKNTQLSHISLIKNGNAFKKKKTSSATNNASSTESIKNKQLIYLCSQCADQFLTVEECKEHMIKVHKLCTDNEVETNLEDVEQLHVPENKDDVNEKNKKIIEKFFTQDNLTSKKYKCSKCHYKFSSPKVLCRHEACHLDDSRGQFRCSECGENQTSWRACSIHLYRSHLIDVDLCNCPLCSYKATSLAQVKHHLKIHGEERDYVCAECGRGFKQPSQLRNHRVIHLDRKMHDTPRWYSQKHCEKCGKTFADSKCLKKHIQAIHSKLKPFICNVCGHSCARKAMLQMHLRQHTGEKPYACKLCFYRTGDHNSLRRHAMRHTGARPYKCPHCDYTAIQSNSYKNHLASKHPGMGGSFSCTECPFKTVNEDTFTSHQNDHRNGLIESNKTTNSDSVSKTSSSSSPELSVGKDNRLYSVSGQSKILFVSGEKKSIDTEDDETQNFLSLSDLTDEQTVDTGGITIPADPLDI